MRINSVRLREIKESIEEHLEKCKIYQKEYYYMSEELFLNWKSLKANYYKDLLIKEKNSNEKTIYKVETFLLIIDEILKKYDKYDNMEFEIDFSDVLVDNINKIIDRYVNVNYKYNMISSTNNTTIEVINKNIAFVNKSIELYNNLKSRIKELSANINESEKYIHNKLINYAIDVIEKSPKVLKIKGDAEALTFDSTKITIIKSKLEGKYKLISDEIISLIEKIDSISSYYNTGNSSLLIEKINLLKVNLKIAESNFVNDIELLNDELDAKTRLQTKLKVNLKGFELHE